MGLLTGFFLLVGIKDGTDATFRRIDCNIAAIIKTADNVQKVPAEFSLVEVIGDVEQPFNAYLRISILKDGEELVHTDYSGLRSSLSYNLPADQYGDTDMVRLSAYDDAACSRLVAVKDVIVVTDNPIPFPREDEWNAANTYKNGEYHLLDGIVYMWRNPVPGNSVLAPPEDIKQNPLTTSWTAYQNWPLLCTGMLLSDFAKIGQAVFAKNYTISQQGKGEGDYRNFDMNTGEGTFQPNIIIDWVKGTIKLLKLVAEGADISGTVKATSGNIGRFLIDEDGLSRTEGSSEVKLSPEYMRIIRVVENVFGEIARCEARMGKNADPAYGEDEDFQARTAAYFYRRMNDSLNTYVPAVRILSENVVNRNIGLRVDGGAIVAEQGVMERVCAFNSRTDFNVLPVHKGGCFMVYNEQDRTIYLPTRDELCSAFGKNYRVDWVTARITVASHRGSPQEFELAFQSTDLGTFYDHNGNTFTPKLSKGDAFEFFLVSEPTAYWALEVNANE